MYKIKLVNIYLTKAQCGQLRMCKVIHIRYLTLYMHLVLFVLYAALCTFLDTVKIKKTETGFC